MADDSGHQELHRNRDPHGSPPLPDGDQVHSEPVPQPDPYPLTTRQKLTALLVVVIVVAAVVIGALR
ncbi:hypothetical protein [Salinispora mooreana]|uniref:hypothetical protein n=1 Tax=Salinispora mooreana TaxID=999545 RepID=UPI0003747315|nr:hypothetical protein [Salinispora mooreana]